MARKVMATESMTRMRELPVIHLDRNRKGDGRSNERKTDISEKCLLTLEEAARYTGIGTNKLRELSNSKECGFVLWNGSKRMFKREKLKDYLYGAFSI